MHLGTPPPKDYAKVGEIYIPQILLTQQDLEPADALRSLRADDQFDEVQLLANEAARVYKSISIPEENLALLIAYHAPHRSRYLGFWQESRWWYLGSSYER